MLKDHVGPNRIKKEKHISESNNSKPAPALETKTEVQEKAVVIPVINVPDNTKPVKKSIKRDGIPSYQSGTAAILIGMILVFVLEGGLIGYLLEIFFPEDIRWTYGAMTGLLVSAILALYCKCHKINIDKYGSSFQKATEFNAPELCEIVSGLSAKAGIRTPRIFIIKDKMPNAYALANSPDDAMVAITTAGLDLWSHDEVEGIMGHELSHILHRDTVVNQTARTCAKVLTASASVMGAVALISAIFLGASAGTKSRSSKNNDAEGIVFLIIAAITIPIIIVGGILYFMVPPASAALRFGVSRSREYGADESSAMLTGKPMALASALIKCEDICLKSSDYKDVASENLWVVNPLRNSKRKKLTARLLSTHPSTEDRVKRLEKLNQKINGPSIYQYMDG